MVHWCRGGKVRGCEGGENLGMGTVPLDNLRRGQEIRSQVIHVTTVQEMVSDDSSTN
jgi:hypothetical protein